jgi:uncharacterized cupredoxin-like copper-binding protein
MRRLFFAALMLAAPAVQAAMNHGGHSHGAAFGEPGDPSKPARSVEIVMREADGKMLFEPSRIQVKRGEQIRFSLRNAGELEHEIVLATLEENQKHAKEMMQNPEMMHDEPNAKRLAPGKTGEILWKFSRSGSFDFSCLIPGHREAGMSGVVTVR